MGKKIAGAVLVCIGICGFVIIGLTLEPLPVLKLFGNDTAVATTPEPIDVDTTITINPDWELGYGWKWGYGDIVLFEELDGCVCGEPRDDGRMCDVYVEYVYVTDTMLKVWTDVSREQLGNMVGVEWVSMDGKYLHRDPRYRWETIIEGICALADDAAQGQP